jgi:hypothetical protein
MAYTPYPYSNGKEENPCVAVSSDLVNWITPEGLHNPIATLYEDNCDELKDTELVYNNDTDQLEVWYLGRINSSLKVGNGPLRLFRKRSSDGLNWGDREVLFSFNEYKLISHSVIYEGSKYKLWGIRCDNDYNDLYYMESTDAKTWSMPKRCHMDKFPIWHGGVSRINDKYCFVWVGFNSVLGKANGRNIMCAWSNDGINFSTPQPILNCNPCWHNFYRPYLVMDNDKYYLYYGVKGHDKRWLIGLSSGENVEELRQTYSRIPKEFAKPVTYSLIKRIILKCGRIVQYVISILVS